MSFSLARDSEQKIGPSTSLATRRMQSSSPGEAAAKPASMISTPRSLKTCAIFTLAWADMEKPGACSPSRIVVSKMMTRLGSAAISSVRDTPDTRTFSGVVITRPRIE